MDLVQIMQLRYLGSLERLTTKEVRLHHHRKVELFSGQVGSSALAGIFLKQFISEQKVQLKLDGPAE